MGSAAQGGNVRTQLPGRGITSSAARASAPANDVCRKDRGDGLTVDRRLESPAKKMALVAGVFIVAPDVRISILAMGSPMRPYTLTQTDQSFSKSYLQVGRAIRFLSKRFSSVRSATHSFRARASRRRSCTSPVVAARAVSPANRRLPASINSFDQV
jgi:hypothetical protein